MADIKKIGLFAGGVLFGSAGIKALSSKDAKKIYTHGTAAVLRVKDCLMKQLTFRRMQRISLQKLSRSTKKEKRAKQKKFWKQFQRLQKKNRIEALRYEVHN